MILTEKSESPKKHQEEKWKSQLHCLWHSQHFSICSWVNIGLVFWSVFILRWGGLHRALELASFLHSKIGHLASLFFLPGLFYIIILCYKLFSILFEDGPFQSSELWATFTPKKRKQITHGTWPLSKWRALNRTFGSQLPGVQLPVTSGRDTFPPCSLVLALLIELAVWPCVVSYLWLWHEESSCNRATGPSLPYSYFLFRTRNSFHFIFLPDKIIGNYPTNLTSV